MTKKILNEIHYLVAFFSSGDVFSDEFTVQLKIVMDLATLHNFVELCYEFCHG